MHEERPLISIAVIIIRRDLVSVAAYLREELRGVASFVAVIVDRGYRDRRRRLDGRSTERRQTGRRRRSVAEELHENGWAIVIVNDRRANSPNRSSS
jgi:hypothetical protein